MATIQAKKRAPQPKRQIRTNYFFGKELVKTTMALYPNRAVPTCVDHVQFNNYEATHAEVFDERTGELHAVVKRHIGGAKMPQKIEVEFRREVAEVYRKKRKPAASAAAKKVAKVASRKGA